MPIKNNECCSINVKDNTTLVEGCSMNPKGCSMNPEGCSMNPEDCSNQWKSA